MKTMKREKLMIKIAVATLFLGAYSPLAEATISPKDGVSLSELSAIVPDLEVIHEGSNLILAGLVPERCAKNFSHSYRTEGDKHLLTIRMPKCESGFKREADDSEDQVDLATLIPAIKLKDVDGKVYLRHEAEVSKASRNRIVDEVLPTADGQEIVLTSTKTQEEASKAEEERLAEEERVLLAKEEQAARDRRYDDLAARVLQLCQDNDYVGLTSAIHEASDLLGDVSSMLTQANNGLKGKLKKDLEKAETADDARAAYEAYIAAAADHGWDEEEITQAYIEKRFDILNILAEDSGVDKEEGEVALSQVDKELRAWSSEFRSLDRREYKKNQEKFGEIYSAIATKAANAGNVDKAESYYDKAKKFVDGDADVKIDGALAKIYTEKYKECVKNGPWKMESCDKKYLGKIKNRADSIKSALSGRSGEDAADELAAFQSEYISTFGAGSTYNVSGFGQVTQMPGAIHKFKAQTYQEYMQQKQMEMYQQQMYGGMAAAPGSNMFGF